MKSIETYCQEAASRVKGSGPSPEAFDQAGTRRGAYVPDTSGASLTI